MIYENKVKSNLKDVGCSDQSAAFVNQLVQAGRFADAIHEMKVIRCGLMEELHRSQRKVDCLDYLIRQTEKEFKSTKERRQSL